MRRISKIAVVAVVASLALAGCGSNDDDKNTDTNSGSEVKVGLAYDVGGRGDQSFNDSAAAGLDEAKSEFAVTSQESEASTGEPESAREERLTQMAEAGFNPVIAVGFAYEAAIQKVAPQFPETEFAIIDNEAAVGDNIANLVFTEEQGSFLVGVAAALKSKKKNVGFIGGVNVPLIVKFEAGFKAGVKAIDPAIKIQSTYLTQPPDFSGFNDSSKGETTARGMFDNGADVVYHAAGGSGLGVFKAAKASKGLGIGVDSDQYNTLPEDLRPFVLTSMLKKVDVAVYDYIKSFVDGEPLNGPVRFDLEQGGVDYSLTGGQVDDIKDQIDEYKAKIISGEITVPTQ